MKYYDNPQVIAEKLNDYFVESPFRILENFKKGIVTHEAAISNKTIENSIFIGYLTEDDVLDIINHRLKNKHSSGFDGISPYVN